MNWQIICILLTFITTFLSADPKKTSVCLNMIVKDEESTITRCLDSVVGLIDYWVIVDTGSQDNTKGVIAEYFKQKGINGELHEKEWVNFEWNRNHSYALSKSKADYTLFMDADEYLEMDENFVLPKLEKDFYYMVISHSGSEYSRKSLVKNSLNWKWKGVLHEYIEANDAFSYATLTGVKRIYTFDGVRSRDPDKYLHDCELLEKTLKDEPDNSRYRFYLAQSYFDAGDIQNSLSAYQKYLEVGTWDQEIYWTLLRIAIIKERLDYPHNEVLECYQRAFFYRPSRIEALYFLSNYYRKMKDHVRSYDISKIATSLQPSTDKLFVNRWIENIGVKLELALSAYWTEKYDESKKICHALLEEKSLSSVSEDCVQEILKFIKIKNGEVSTGLMSKKNSLTSRKKIAIITYPASLINFSWDSNSVIDGIAGSEESVIYLSQELSKIGYNVTIYGNPPPTSKDSLPHSNPRYVSYRSIAEIDNNYDVAIVWRMPDICKWMTSKAREIYLWPHDTLNTNVSDENITALTDVFWLTDWQRQQWGSINPLFLKFEHICGNGIPEEHCYQVQKRENPLSCIYASNYGRGLEILIELWPKVIEEFPTATLDIYYGWETWGLLSDNKIADLKRKIDKMKHLNVREHGKVGHQELTEAFHASSIWAYPCTHAETFCITALRAQSAGAIPVVIKHSGLCEVIKGGPDCVDNHEYLNTLLNTMRSIKNYSLKERRELSNTINTTSQWKNVAQLWHKILNKN